MSNYKWVKESERYVDLRTEDFISTSFFSLPLAMINPLLLDKLSKNGIDYDLQGDSCELSAIDSKIVTITAPLYGMNFNTCEFELLEESYTNTAIAPTQYDWIKATYQRCAKEVANEQAKIFEEQFMEKSLDEGNSAVIDISSDIFEEPSSFYSLYIPKSYIKACERNVSYRHITHEVVFIKKMDANGQIITIKVPDLYKGLVIGKGGENIKKIAEMINAKRINVI